MTTQVHALFADRHAAHAAIEQLVQAGFARDTISVMMSATTHEREFGSPSSSRPASPSRRQGVLAAIAASVIAFASPSGLALRAAGPLVGTLVRSVRATDALPAALAAAGLDASEARFVDQGVREGSIVVGVHTGGERARLAAQLLELSGGAFMRAA